MISEDKIKQIMDGIENRIRHAYNCGYQDGYEDARSKVKADIAERVAEVIAESMVGGDTEFNYSEYEQLKEWADSVVRCKDCIHFKETGGHANCGGYLSCRRTGKAVDFEDYCSRGEKA